jgi:ribonuclease P protein component
VAFETLRGRWEFKRVASSGHSKRSDLLKVSWYPNGLPGNRYGIAATVACGKAVVRNRIRRWAKELLRAWDRHIADGHDIVVLANRAQSGEDFQLFKADLARALKQAKLTGEDLATGEGS